MKLNSDISAVITGGASGLGAATARLLASHGVKVATFDMNEAVGQGEQPRREGRGRRERGGRDRNKPRSEAGGRNEPRSESRNEGRNRHGERQPGEGQGGDENFKGMGDHVPAFLLRTLGKREDA